MKKISLILMCAVALGACTLKKSSPLLFEKLDHVGIDFTNKVTDEKDNNIFKYRNFYNRLPR